MLNKVKIAYVCVHNSCRSQMAEAITKTIAGDCFDVYSFGTEISSQINQDAVRIIKKIYDLDMNLTQRSKLITDVPLEFDVLITMGCNVECPFIPSQHQEDWGLEDPSGKNDQAFYDIALMIRDKVLDLRKRIENKSIKIT